MMSHLGHGNAHSIFLKQTTAAKYVVVILLDQSISDDNKNFRPLISDANSHFGYEIVLGEAKFKDNNSLAIA